jgi:hypothetical protein
MFGNLKHRMLFLGFEKNNISHISVMKVSIVQDGSPT